MLKLKAKELRKTAPTEEKLKEIKRNPIYFILDGLYDTYNVGSIFRLADAIAAEKIFLCGKMEYPPSSRIHKAAVGTEEWVPWEKKESTKEVILSLKENSVHVMALEQDNRSILYKDIKPVFPVAIVFGNETGGISKEVLDMVDTIVELPVLGINNSFNVWGSGAVVAYKLLEFLI